MGNPPHPKRKDYKHSKCALKKINNYITKVNNNYRKITQILRTINIANYLYVH